MLRASGFGIAATLLTVVALVTSLVPETPRPALAVVNNTCSGGTGTVSVSSSGTTHVVSFTAASACTYVLPGDVSSLDYLVVGGGGGGGTGADSNPQKGGQGGRGGVATAVSEIGRAHV